MGKMKQWLEFDNEKFEEAKTRGEEESKFYGFLNVTVTKDAEGGDGEETVITFNTKEHGGTDIFVEAESFPSDYDFTSGKVKLTLYGGLEANAFFSAMENLVHCYKLRRTIGD